MKEVGRLLLLYFGILEKMGLLLHVIFLIYLDNGMDLHRNLIIKIKINNMIYYHKLHKLIIKIKVNKLKIIKWSHIMHTSIL